MLATHEAAKADVTIAAKPVHRARGRRRWASCASTTPAASSASSRSRKTDERAQRRAHGPAVARRPRHRQPRPRLPGQHGHLPLQPRDAAATRWTKTNYHDFGKEMFPAVDRARGTCRSTCSTATGKTSARSARSTTRTCSSRSRTRRSSWHRATAPIYTRPRFLPPTRIDGATITQQPRRRRLRDRRGHADREQRHRPALPHRPRRDDSQLGAHGRRLLRNARPAGGRPQRRPAADRHRRRQRSSRARSSTRTVTSAPARR